MSVNHQQERPQEVFSKKFHACLAAYDHAGGDPDEKKQFKEQVRHALGATEYNGPPINADTAAVPAFYWAPILRELDAMDAALRLPGAPSSSSPVEKELYRPEKILRMWEPVLMHEIVALRGKVGRTTISTRGSVYDRYDHNPFRYRLNNALDLYKFYLDEQYKKIYFKEGCQVLEKRFLERLDTALTSPKILGPQVDLDAKHPGQTWRSILKRLEALHGALERAATTPSEADRRVEPLKRLNKVLLEALPQLESLIRKFRAGELGTTSRGAAGHSEHSLALQTSRALQRRQVYLPLARR